MQKSVPLKKIKANPHRKIDDYPISREKVNKLKESFEKTGFWGNIVARENNGHVEIAYGHHRWTALKESHKPTDKIDLIIKDLDEEDMIKIMARENMAEWGTSATVEHETVKATVEAYAKGKGAKGGVDLPAVAEDASKNQIRHAPSYLQGVEPAARSVARPYTAETLVAFVGYKIGKTRLILQRLETIERGILDEQALKELSTTDADKVAKKARDTFDETKARMEEPKTEAQEKKVEERATRTARYVSNAMADAIKRKENGEDNINVAIRTEMAERKHMPRVIEPLPDINEYVDRLILHADHFLSRADSEWSPLGKVVKHQDALKASQRARIKKALKGASERAAAFLAKF